MMAIAAVLIASDALAFRPFDGTDASVAEQGEFELEAGFGRSRAVDATSLDVPTLSFNYGLLRNTEITLEGKWRHDAGTSRGELADPSISMKHVWIAGTLQDASGPSLATECDLLLPEPHGDRSIGGECAAILSSRWEAGALHLNAGLGHTRARETSRTVSLIAEGPASWGVRPVAEFLAERDGRLSRVSSALLGAIWQHGDDLAFDFALRRADGSDGHVNELRLGVTWNFAAGRHYP
jgi:hypothetical protein